MKPEEERIVIDANNHYCSNMDGLFDKLRTEDGSVILMENGLKKIVHLLGISREDGSGFSFIVSLYVNSKVREIYVNDIDGRRKADLKAAEKLAQLYLDMRAQ